MGSISLSRLKLNVSWSVRRHVPYRLILRKTHDQFTKDKGSTIIRVSDEIFCPEPFTDWFSILLWINFIAITIKQLRNITPIFKFQTYLNGLMFSMRFRTLYIVAPGPAVIVYGKILAVPWSDTLPRHCLPCRHSNTLALLVTRGMIGDSFFKCG